MKRYRTALLMLLCLVVILSQSACSERESPVNTHNFVLVLEEPDSTGQISAVVEVEGEEITDDSFTEQYEEGEEISLKIEPKAGGEFLGWREKGAEQGDYLSTEEEIEYEIKGETYLIAEIDYGEAISEIDIVGPDEVEIPTINDDSNTVDYDIIPRDEDGEEIEELDLKFETLIKREDGSSVIIADANELELLNYRAINYDQIELEVEENDKSTTKTVDLARQEAEAELIEYKPEEFGNEELEQLYVPNEGYLDYQINIKDQYKQNINHDLDFNIASSVSGIEIDGRELRVYDSTEEKDLEIEVESDDFDDTKKFETDLKKAAEVSFSVENRETGEPIKDARVEISDLKGEEFSQVVYSNQDGEVDFIIGLGEEIEVSVSGEGYQSEETEGKIENPDKQLESLELATDYQKVTKPDSDKEITGGGNLGTLEYAKTETELYLKLNWESFAAGGISSDHFLLMINDLDNEIGYTPYYQYDSYTTGWEDDSYNVAYKEDFFDLNFIVWSWVDNQGDFNFDDAGANQVLKPIDEDEDDELDEIADDVKEDINFSQNLDEKIYYFKIPYQTISQEADKNNNYEVAIILGQEGFGNITDTYPQKEEWVIESPSIDDNERDVTFEYGAGLE